MLLIQSDHNFAEGARSAAEVCPKSKVIAVPGISNIYLTKKLLSAKLSIMKRLHKKTIGGLLLIPLLFVITLCCCVDDQVHADEAHGTVDTEQHHDAHEVEKTDHSEHQHSDGDHECTCPKHLSFLPNQPADTVLNSSFSKILTKDLLVNLHAENIVFLVSLSNQSQGPPGQDHLDHNTPPIYLKLHNLRL
ncbi:MAG: hypothetical protein H6753_01115 [Candidatus Omnitrophica bacterium]|nr:hypothetical protein [Candidatus Omnitrophota bacterium]